MPEIFNGRYTANVEEPFVVFLIGMRVNNIFAVRAWWQVVSAMPRMLKSLYQHPEKGFLGGHMVLYSRGIGLFSYWESFEKLEKFARDPDDAHLPAWREFNKLVGSNGTVGIWHETYRVDPRDYEGVYGNMPQWGLAKATDHVPATGRRETARRRLGGENEPAVESPVTPGAGQAGS